MLDDISAALSAIENEGTFATRLSCPSKGLNLRVEGIGPIRYPVSAEMAWKLKSVARPAPYGLRDQTLVEKRVRDTWEIGADKLVIDETQWRPVLVSNLALIRKRLGLPDGATLEAKLDKMLIYGPGQFFAVHQDSERSGDMIGTLVVQLPTRHEGGELVVAHHGATKVFSGEKQDASELSLFAFYSDCHHEVKPVSFGFRISLTYQIRQRGTSKRASAVPPEIQTLESCVRDYFASPLERSYPRETNAPPDRLVYLLDHEYTQHSLVWDRLKNGDALRASALKDVAGLIDAEVYLTLVDIHEAWSCQDDWTYGYGGRRGRSYFDEDDEENDNEEKNDPEYQLIDLIDSHVELHHWIDENGNLAPFGKTEVDEDEVCSTRPSGELTPYKKEHEGYTGNAGNTLDRWYHRAAVVMWPRANAFVIKAKQSASWAIDQIAERISAGEKKEARALADVLLPFWEKSVRGDSRAAFTAKLFFVVDSLEDERLASRLLGPLAPHLLMSSTTVAFAKVVSRFGLAWSQNIFEHWIKNRRYDDPDWIRLLPSICQSLLAVGGKNVEAFALWLVSRQISALENQRTATHIAFLPMGKREEQKLLAETLALLEAVATLDNPALQNKLISILTTPLTAFPVMTTGALLQKCRDVHPPAVIKLLGVGPVFLRTVGMLESFLARPVRDENDWSIEPPSGCACALCKTLSTFLRDPASTTLTWPLAKERRQHIHSRIDAFALPVTHETLRQGSPQKLVLTKTKALFEQATRLRERQSSLLSWLHKERGAFCVKPDPERHSSP